MQFSFVTFLVTLESIQYGVNHGHWHFVLSSPVRKYRKKYCSHFGAGVGFGVSISVGAAQMLKFFLLKLL